MKKLSWLLHRIIRSCSPTHVISQFCLKNLVRELCRRLLVSWWTNYCYDIHAYGDCGNVEASLWVMTTIIGMHALSCIVKAATIQKWRSATLTAAQVDARAAVVSQQRVSGWCHITLGRETERLTHRPLVAQEEALGKIHSGGPQTGAGGQEVMRVMWLQVRGHCDGHMWLHHSGIASR